VLDAQAGDAVGVGEVEHRGGTIAGLRWERYDGGIALDRP
jgi:hypothetical protein